MLLAITTTHNPATDLGYLLHKHPDRVQQFSITGGKAHVFYSEVGPKRCTACLLLELDSIDLVRKLKIPRSSLSLGHYVNDRPYVASSFTSSAIARVYSSALNGKCRDKPELVQEILPLEVALSCVKVPEGTDRIRAVFEPLNYQVEVESQLLDPTFPDWGKSPYYAIKLRGNQTIQDLLAHLYVLLPVFDQEKHYWVGKSEVEKLLDKGGNWLAAHPEKDWIIRRYLKYVPDLTELYKDQLNTDLAPTEIHKPSLHQLRLESVYQQLKHLKVQKVADLGCGEGKLLKMLLQDGQFTQILGMDVSPHQLIRAKKKLNYDQLSPEYQDRLSLIQGALTYYDKRLEGFDAAVLIEVIEHLDLNRLKALEKMLFEFIRPKNIILTTPNADYNVHYGLTDPASKRHADHRFEWGRKQFEEWANQLSEQHKYNVSFYPIGEVATSGDSPSQMAIFQFK